MIIGVASNDYRTAATTPTGREEWGGSGWVRLGQWLPLWAEHHTVVYGVAYGEVDHIEIAVERPDGSAVRVTPDLVYFQRQMLDMTGLQARARAGGQIVVHDLDDWYWGIDSRNQGSRTPAHMIATYSANLAGASLVTVSTPYLADRMSERLDVPIVVIPNHVDVARFTPVGHDVELPTIGWVGATARRSGDLGELKGVLSRLRGQARFAHSGAEQGWPTFAAETGLAADEVSELPSASFRDYPALLTFQIGTAPLRMTPFNEAKSELKGLEYAAAGIPFVASPSASYLELAREWGDAVAVARKPADWVRHLRRLLDAGARRERAAELRELVRSRDLAHGVRYYLDLFGGLG